MLTHEAPFDVENSHLTFPSVTIAYSPQSRLTICRIDQTDNLKYIHEFYPNRMSRRLFAINDQIFRWHSNRGLADFNLEELINMQNTSLENWQNGVGKLLNIPIVQNLLRDSFKPENIEQDHNGSLVLAHGLAYGVYRTHNVDDIAVLSSIGVTLEQLNSIRMFIANYPKGIRNLLDSGSVYSYTDLGVPVDHILPPPIILS